MNTARQNPSSQPPPTATNDPLLAEAMALTWRDYRGAFDEVKDDPRADEVRVTAERISEAIRSDARLSAFADRPEFVDWAVREVAKGKEKNISEVSADEAKAALDAPRGTLVTHLLDVLKRDARSPGYIRNPLQAVLDDRRAWTGQVGQFATAAVDDLHVAKRLDVDVLGVARERGLEPFDVLDAVKRARSRATDDPSWYTAKDQAAHDDMLKGAFESELAREPAMAGSGMTGSARSVQAVCGPSLCAVSCTSLDEPPLPEEMAWARTTDPCDSLDYLRSLVRTFGIGENGQLFQAGELLADRWAQATNWCWPGEPPGQTERSAANCQSFDDLLYWLRRRNARTDTAYAMRAEIYQEQLENRTFQQAWNNFVSQVTGYLSAPRTEATIPSYRCLGVYMAAEALRRAAAAQLTGLARMQIKELGGSLQFVWRLFTDPRVIGIINPAAAGSQPSSGTASYIGKDPADQAAVVFGVAQQLLGPQSPGLYQAWDKAILLDQVFAWVQLGRVWSPGHTCEDAEFVKLLGAMSALVPGAGQISSATPASLIGTTE
jgi:hypothetical protein